jgi:hypothetical protein
MKWFNVAGLIFDLLGAGIITASVVASRAGIDRMTASLYGIANPDAQADRRRQSCFAIVGLVILCIGFVLQIIGSWPR